MTGTGTQADPYIVTNVDEFIEAAPQNGNAYIKLGADINMDGVQDQYVSFTELDGDNHKFINMVTIADVSAGHHVLRIILLRNTKIKNVDFSSCLVNLGGTLINLVSSSSATGSLTIENCNFSVCLKMADNKPPTIFSGGSYNNRPNLNINLCVFDITYESTTNAASLINAQYMTPYIEDSHFKMNITVHGNRSDQGTLLPARSFRNVYITGSFDNDSAEGTGSYLINGEFYHTYVAIESQRRGKTNVMYGTCYDVCFYDNQLWSGSEEITVTNNGMLYALPTEKCKDMDYLNSIGFYVAPGE